MTIEEALNLAARRCAAGQWSQAEAIYRRVLEVRPDLPQVHHNLGHALQQGGQIDAAIEAYRQALRLKPDLLESLTNLGNLLLAKGEKAQATDSLARVVAAVPEFAEGRNNLGNALVLQGRIEEGLAQLNRAVALAPDRLEFRVNLAHALGRGGRWDEAAAQFQQAISLRSREVGLYAGLANAHYQAGDLENAVQAFARATELNPLDAPTWSNLAAVRLRLGQLTDAESAGKRAVELGPQNAAALSNFAAVLQACGKLDETISYYDRSLAIAPDAAVASNRIMALYLHPRYDAAALLDEQRKWDRTYAQPLMPRSLEYANDRSPDRRLRIGYVSADLREHPVGWNLLPLLSHHDPEQFEIFAYSAGRRKDALTEKLASHCHTWREIGALDDEHAAELIRGDRIDVLVDLSGHAASNRLLVFAQKPAPVQVFWLSYPGGTGLSSIDYRLSDPHIDPPGEEVHYAEKTVRLPATFWCYQPGGEAPNVSLLPMEAAGRVTFGCLTNFAKVGAAALELGGNILASTANSRLILNCPDGSPRERLREQFLGQGITANRLEFVSRQPWRDYMAAYHRIDIALDPTPYGGGITTCDSFWMGVPVISLLGRTSVGRGGASILRNVGLPELVASDAKEYVRIAEELAADPVRLSKLRGDLRTRMRQSALMDSQRFAKDVETAYREMWRAWTQK